LMCKRVRRLLQRSVHRGNYKAMITPRWSTRTEIWSAFFGSFFLSLLFPWFSGRMLRNHSFF
jgi:hypothetical protein